MYTRVRSRHVETQNTQTKSDNVVTLGNKLLDGGGFFLACEVFGENVRQFIPRLRFLIFFKILYYFKEVEISSRETNSTLYARISPQWLGERRRLWPNVP